MARTKQTARQSTGRMPPRHALACTCSTCEERRQGISRTSSSASEASFSSEASHASNSQEQQVNGSAKVTAFNLAKYFETGNRAYTNTKCNIPKTSEEEKRAFYSNGGLKGLSACVEKQHQTSAKILGNKEKKEKEFVPFKGMNNRQRIMTKLKLARQ